VLVEGLKHSVSDEVAEDLERARRAEEETQ
jgi:hypothetical protein